MAACRQLGLQVGTHIAITGYGNSEAAAYACPPLSSVDHAIVDNGRHLAEVLLRVMAGEAPDALQRLEPVHFIERASVYAAPSVSTSVRTHPKS